MIASRGPVFNGAVSRDTRHCLSPGSSSACLASVACSFKSWKLFVGHDRKILGGNLSKRDERKSSNNAKSPTNSPAIRSNMVVPRPVYPAVSFDTRHCLSPGSPSSCSASAAQFCDMLFRLRDFLSDLRDSRERISA